MGDNSTSLYESLWATRFWFPRKLLGVSYSWDDVKNVPGSSVYYPEMRDIHWGILLGALLVVVRYALETVLFRPLGYKLGIRRKRTYHLDYQPALETAYKTNKTVDSSIYMALSKQLDMPVRKVEIWFRKRKINDMPAPIHKFCDNSWSLIFYTLAFIYGLIILWNKPWLWKTMTCWDGWPKQHVSSELYWYYMFELAFYWGLVFTLFVDHKRKDFKEMMCHHFATIVLIYFSWLVNFVRIGSLVMLLHDASDPWLALAKMGIYLKKKSVTDPAFGVFVLMWVVSRLVYFPLWILNSTLFEVFNIIEETFFVYYFFNIFLSILLVLHGLWTVSIFTILYNTLTKGDVQDTRSDSEEHSSLNEAEMDDSDSTAVVNGTDKNQNSDATSGKNIYRNGRATEVKAAESNSQVENNCSTGVRSRFSEHNGNYLEDSIEKNGVANGSI